MQRLRLSLTIAKVCEDGKTLAEEALSGGGAAFKQDNGSERPQGIRDTIGVAELPTQCQRLLMVRPRERVLALLGREHSEVVLCNSNTRQVTGCRPDCQHFIEVLGGRRNVSCVPGH